LPTDHVIGIIGEQPFWRETMNRTIGILLALGLGFSPLVTQAHDIASTGSTFHAHHTAAITTGRLNLRSGPGKSYPVVAIMPVNTEVNVYDCHQEGSWCHVSYAGFEGWAWHRFLRPATNQHALANHNVIVIPKGYKLKAIVKTGPHSHPMMIVTPK
jgi:uncharacterized protein YraI